MNDEPPAIDVDQYRGEWVALDPDTHAVVSHDRSLKEAELKAIQRGISSPLLLPVTESEGFFVGAV